MTAARRDAKQRVVEATGSVVRVMRPDGDQCSSPEQMSSPTIRVDAIRAHLERNGPDTAKGIATALGVTRKDINPILYKHGGTFIAVGDSPPTWHLQGSIALVASTGQEAAANSSPADELQMILNELELRLSKSQLATAAKQALGTRLAAVALTLSEDAAPSALAVRQMRAALSRIDRTLSERR